MKRAGQLDVYRKKARTDKRGYTKLSRQLPPFRGSQFPSEELKVKDLNLSIEAINTTGTFTLLNGLQQGSDFTNRVGRKVMWKSLYVRFLVQHDRTSAGAGAGVSPNSSVRIIIIHDMQTNGATPTVAALLNSANTTAPLNLDNRDRFKVLMDKFYAMPGVSKTATDINSAGNTAFTIKKYRKINFETIFNSGTSGAVADINSGAVWLFIIGDQASGDNCSTVNGSVRMRFADP